MSNSPKKKFNIGKFIAVFLLPACILVGLLLTVFRNLFENFSVMGLIMLIVVVVLFVIPMIAGVSMFFSDKDDK